MPELESLGWLVAGAVVFFLIPGPAVLYIIARSLEGGFRAGAMAAVGMTAGAAVQVSLAALGIASILAARPDLLALLRFGGAAYLIWLGMSRLLGRQPARVQGSGDRHVFFESALVNLLNPKAILFYLAVVPVFVDPALGPVGLQTALVGALLIGVGLLCDLAWSAVVGLGLQPRLASSARAGRISRVASGGLLIALGLAAALSGAQSSSSAAVR